MLLAAIVCTTPDAARAQDIISDFFGGIFGGGGSRHIIQRSPEYRRPRQHVPERRVAPYSESHAPRVARPVRTPRRGNAPEETAAPEQPPTPADFFVAVTGDTLGQILADGLDEAFEDTPQIGILHKGKESSGLVRKDYYDWSKAAGEIATGQQKLDVAVMMIGSNDRQALSEGGQTLEPLSPRWREAYAGRIDAIIQIFKEKKIPLIWVGLPVMKNERFSADMAEINGIYRARAAAAGIPFIDLWDKFADDQGKYSAFGPDVNGQTVKLRSDDGVHFTGAGARKVAHFVEGEIKRIYDARQQPAPAAGAPPAAAVTTPSGDAAAPPLAPAQPAAPIVFHSPAGEPPPAAPSLPQDRPAIGPIQPLAGAPAPASDELARRDKAHGGPQAAASAERALAQHVFVEGGDQPPRPGRADDFSRPAVAQPNPAPAKE
jgi:hypothetical protein